MCQVSDEDLAKARSMVPQALQPYVEQLAKHGPGSYSMPKVGNNCIHFNLAHWSFYQLQQELLINVTKLHFRSATQLFFLLSLSPLTFQCHNMLSYITTKV